MRRLPVMLVVFLCACRPSEVPAPKEPAETQAASVEQPHREPVRLDPALVALAEYDDPDLKTSISPEEAEATLRSFRERQEAAQAPRPPLRVSRAPRPLDMNAPSDWEILEFKKTLEEEYLAQPVIYGPDRLYHLAGCASTYEFADPLDPASPRRFVGATITLANAKTRKLSPHRECGPPSYDISSF